MTPVSIYLAVEDELSEHVLRRVLAEHERKFDVRAVYGKEGYGYLKKKAPGFNHAAQACPFLLLTDLDTYECPPDLLRDWLQTPQHPHFLLRVAVREVEAWLLGDVDGLRRFLGVRSTAPIPAPESIPDPKAALLDLALTGRKRAVREAVVARDERTGRLLQGPDYNGTLGQFVRDHWDSAKARRSCPSLERMWAALGRIG
jgi:hypothetical protein